jgi:ribosomal protein S20
MNNISSGTPAANLNQNTNQSTVSQLAKNFQAIGSALQAGNVSSAQNALTAFQQALPSTQTSSSQPFGKNSQANTDYQNLTSSLASGDLAGAQKAFTSLQNDLKSGASASGTKSAHKGHHHHRSSEAASATTVSTTSATGSTAAQNSGSTTASVVGGNLLNVTA